MISLYFCYKVQRYQLYLTINISTFLRNFHAFSFFTILKQNFFICFTQKLIKTLEDYPCLQNYDYFQLFFINLLQLIYIFKPQINLYDFIFTSQMSNKNNQPQKSLLKSQVKAVITQYKSPLQRLQLYQNTILVKLSPKKQTETSQLVRENQKKQIKKVVEPYFSEGHRDKSKGERSRSRSRDKRKKQKNVDQEKRPSRRMNDKKRKNKNHIFQKDNFYSDPINAQISSQLATKDDLLEHHKQSHFDAKETSLLVKEQKSNISKGQLKKIVMRKYKTQLCRQYKNGSCERNEKCTFAHGEKELLYPDSIFKANFCSNFQRGTCNKQDCNYVHTRENMIPLTQNPNKNKNNKSREKAFSYGKQQDQKIFYKSKRNSYNKGRQENKESHEHLSKNCQKQLFKNFSSLPLNPNPYKSNFINPFAQYHPLPFQTNIAPRYNYYYPFDSLLPHPLPPVPWNFYQICSQCPQQQNYFVSHQRNHHEYSDLNNANNSKGKKKKYHQK